MLDSERYILGPEVSAFEREFAAYCGAGHAVGVANGTDAITIALRAMGVGPGDEVVVPSFTFYASAEAIPPTGADAGVLRHRPRDLLRRPPRRCARRSRRAPRPSIAVHLFGNVAPIAEIEALGVPVLEDAAQAAGSTVGGAARRARWARRRRSRSSRRRTSAASATADRSPHRDEDVAERARTLRFHGSHDKVTYEQVGYNSRLDELQAAILRVQLPHLDGWADGRRDGGRAL